MFFTNGLELNETFIDLKYWTVKLEDMRFTLMIIEVLLGIFIVLGNFLILVLFYQNRRWLKISHRFIISMSTSDLLQGLINPAIHIYLVGGVKIISTSCTYVMVLASIIILISLFTVLITCVDRYWAIVHPIVYKTKMTPTIANGKHTSNAGTM